MATVRLIPSYTSPDINNQLAVDISIETVFDPTIGPDSDVALARSLMIALNTDAQALADDVLPIVEDTDRRGWWGDYQSDAIWDAWPIGTRLWLLSRAKLTGYGAKQGSTLELIRRYLQETLEPYKTAQICSSYDITVTQVGQYSVTALVVMHRGAKGDIALQFADLWTPYI